MRIVFMGSPDFAVPCLDKLLSGTDQVVAVVTQPDRPKGRGKKIAFTPVKERALSAGIPVLQPEKVNTDDFLSKMRELKPDLVVVVAFGQILKPALLNLPPLGCVNVHASLLPQYRGAAPIHWAIINGEEETGVTTMYMDPGMDTGDMILKERVAIEAEDTVGSLHDKLAAAGARLQTETVELIRQGKAPRERQDHTKATYASLLAGQHEIIHWEKKAQEIHDQIRGMNPWPGAHTTFNGKLLKIWQTQLDAQSGGGEPGQVTEVDNSRGVRVACGENSLWLREVQPEGSRRMTGDAFARGHRLEPGVFLGSGS